MGRGSIVSLGILGLAFSLGLVLPAFGDNRVEVTESEYGSEWPFTIKKGTIVCVQPGVVTFLANGKSYAMNGLAMSDKRNADIHEIWKPDTTSERAKLILQKGRPDLAGNMSIGPILDRGLKLCK